MIFLSDNDIIHKLAACDLLTDAWAALGLNLSDVYVLPTAKHKFGLTKKPDNAEKRYGVDILTRIRLFLSEAREIDFEVPAADLQLLANVDGIDAGEAVLYAAAAQSQARRLATGDKRSLRALATEVICRPIAERLTGRVVCLEQIVRESIQHWGFEHVKLKVLSALTCDTALRAAFGSGADATSTNVLRALDAYIAELRSLPVNLLVS